MILVAASVLLALAPVTDPGPALLGGQPASVGREWAVSRPNRGWAGRYGDSNVYAVWRGASHHERATWLCIRRHESMSYTGENPTSSASGAGQWIDSTWRGIAKWVKVDGRFVARQYARASHAPAWVQDAAYRHVYAQGDLSMWRGTHCAPGMGAS